MKWNKYIRKYNHNTDIYMLYNYYSDEIIAYNSDCADLLDKYFESPNNIEKIHPDLYSELVQKNFLIKDSVDIFELCKKRIINKLSKGDNLQITINPTMDCNLKCWYCYETHIKNSTITPHLKEYIIDFIKKEIESNNYKYVNISFFGGEPLIRINTVVIPIATAIKKLCKNRGIVFHIHFTTNLVLLTKKTINQIKEIDNECYFQVPFDGDEKIHNSIKVYGDNLPTYNIILKNITRALSAGLDITARFNFDHKNITSFEKTIQDLNTIKQLQLPGKLNVTFQKIWQAEESSELLNQLKRLAEIAKTYGFMCLEEYTSIRSSFCYADYKNQYVINYDGNVYKCTARPFTEEYRIGKLDKNGTLKYDIPENEYMNLRFKSYCINCSIFPICHVCWQAHRECLNYQTCHLNLTDDQKENEIYNRFESLLKHLK